jgi:hypothetical protein
LFRTARSPDVSLNKVFSIVAARVDIRSDASTDALIALEKREAGRLGKLGVQLECARTVLLAPNYSVVLPVSRSPSNV